MSEMTVGCIRTTATPPLSGGIYEALLEKTERERDDALERLKDCGSHMMQVCKELEAGEMDCAVDAAIMVMGRLRRAEKDNAELADRLSGLELRSTQELAELQKENKRLEVFAANIHAELMESRKENEEQARLLGGSGSREARLITERDHYKRALEQVSSSSKEWLDSLFREPSEDFVTALRAWIDKKLNEL